ncbi:hypothetical protein Ddc_10480 [Ditylenchus destructor]|nr:hypothetical protein Ddc_10480 [Ditylenchus destructor]
MNAQMRKVKWPIVLLQVICLLIICVELANGFGFPMSGGGGGCGCGGGGGGGGGCGGGCGRKKRSILEEQLRTEESSICPQSEWKRVMIENMDGNVSSSRMAIQSSMYQKFDGYKFFVSCMPSVEHSPTDKGLAMSDLPSKMQFVSNGEAYCNHGKGNIWCTLVALIG